MKLFANIVKVESVKLTTYPGDVEGESLVATGSGSSGKGETFQVSGSPGFIGNPQAGFRGVRIRIGSLDIMIGGINYKIPTPDQGCTKMYGTTPTGSEASYVLADADGNIEVNGSADFAVRFSQLKSGFDQFVNDFNLHSHPSHGAAPSVPSTATIDPSKINEVKMP